MDAQFKAKWVKALRSGKYRQARNGIGNTHEKRLCCLGVGAHVANPKINLRVTSDAVDELVRHGFPGLIVSEGFSRETIELIDMNDAQGAEFPEIADYIEKNL